MEATQLLDMLKEPAFRVTEGIIDYVNPAAAGCMIEAGTPVAKLLFTGHREYEDLTAGCLCLQLQLGSQRLDANVTRTPEGDLFILDANTENPVLQALSLAAADLRGPLTGAINATEQLLNTLPEEAVPNALQLNRRLYQLLRRVGNMSNADTYTKNPTASRDIRDLSAVLSEIFDKASTMAEHTHVAIRYQSFTQGHLCPVDTDILERGVYNMLSNAIHASQPGSVIEATLRQHGRQLHLTVSDSGSGIPTALWGNLYTLYQRQLSYGDPCRGMGLGMVYVKAAATAHGGTVLMESSQEGTRITLTFSLANPTGQLHSPAFKHDYAGNLDHCLVEFSDILPPECYKL